MHVKKGDKVAIIAGKERKNGPSTVLRVLPKENKVVVEGRNLVTKHLKANPMLNRESQILKVEAPIHASNVLIYSEKLGRGVRTQVRYVGRDGALFVTRHEAAASFGEPPKNIKRVRYCVKTQETFE